MAETYLGEGLSLLALAENIVHTLEKLCHLSPTGIVLTRPDVDAAGCSCWQSLHCRRLHVTVFCCSLVAVMSGHC